MYDFILKVILISSSGALSPGPLTLSVASLGVKHGSKAGIYASIGHTLVEFPLVLSIALGLSWLFTIDIIRKALGIAGGSFLIFFGILQIKDYLKSSSESTIKISYKSPFMVGFLLSLLNPFFIIWWLGIGCVLVYDAVRLFGLIGILYMYIAHVWLDYLWLFIVAKMTHMSKKYLTKYKIILIILNIVIVIIGIDFINRTIFT